MTPHTDAEVESRTCDVPYSHWRTGLKSGVNHQDADVVLDPSHLSSVEHQWNMKSKLGPHQNLICQKSIQTLRMFSSSDEELDS